MSRDAYILRGVGDRFGPVLRPSSHERLKQERYPLLGSK
jgi:hypothetical protein